MPSPWTRLHTELAPDGVATVTMGRPPVNAVDLVMYRELRDLFVDIDQIGDGVRAVVLTGDGKHFCAGNDLDDFATMDRDNVRERMFHVREAFFAIQECAVPVVGAVAGAALGTGLVARGVVRLRRRRRGRVVRAARAQRRRARRRPAPGPAWSANRSSAGCSSPAND